jgi:Holliday junction resolvase RusA-like endonuclease
MTYFSCHLDMPPSANRMYRRGPFGMHPSAEYKSWKTAAATEVMARRKGTVFDGPVSVIIIATQPHALRDLDNTIKPTLDALQLGGVITNDNQVRSVMARWSQTFDVPSMEGRDVRVEVRTL